MHEVATRGLTSAEVAERPGDGRTNDVPDPTGRTVGQIVRANVFTPFNVLLGSCWSSSATGEYRDAAFGLLVFVNCVIGIVQELRAKRTLDSLAVVAKPAHGSAATARP